MIATLILPTDRALLRPDLRAVRRTPLPCISRPKELLCLRLRPGYRGAHRCSAIGKSIICPPLRRYSRSGHADTRPTEGVARGRLPARRTAPARPASRGSYAYPRLRLSKRDFEGV